MIGIKVNGRFLKLFPNTRIQLKRSSPLFVEAGKVPGIYSIPFEIPNDDLGHNAAILGTADMVENADDLVTKELAAQLYFDNTPIDSGIIKVEPTEKGNLNITFFAGLRAVDKSFSNTKLKNLNWATTTLHGVDYGADDKPVLATEALAQSLNEAAQPAIVAAMAAGKFKLHRFINSQFSNEALYAGDVNILDATSEPLVNKKWVKKCYQWNTDLVELSNLEGGGIGYTGTISLQIDATTYSKTYGGSPATRLYGYYNPIATDINNIDNQATVKAVAQFNGATGRYELQISFIEDYDTSLNSAHSRLTLSADWVEVTENREVTYQHSYYYVPTFTIQSVFDQIAADYGVVFRGAFFNDTYLQKLYFYSNISLNLPVKITTGDGIDDEEALLIKKEINPGHYMPDWTIGDFVREVCLLFNMVPLYNESAKVITLTYLRDIIKEKNYLCAAKQQIVFNKGTHQPASDTGFTVKFEVYNGETSFFFNHNERVINDGTTELASQFSSIIYLERYGRYEGKEGKINPVIFFDGGMEGTQQKATATALEGFTVQYRLYWSWLSGLSEDLYLDFHKEWLRFRQRRNLMHIDARLELRHLSLIKWEEKIMFDRVKYLIKSIDITISMKGIEPARLELYST